MLCNESSSNGVWTTSHSSLLFPPSLHSTAFSTTLVAILLILSTVTQSAESSDNLQPTQWTLSPDRAESKISTLPVNGDL